MVCASLAKDRSDHKSRLPEQAVPPPTGAQRADGPSLSKRTLRYACSGGITGAGGSQPKNCGIEKKKSLHDGYDQKAWAQIFAKLKDNVLPPTCPR